MKKIIPDLIKILIKSSSKETENIFFSTFNNIIEEQYRFPKHDFDLYCAILVRKYKLEELDESYKNYIIVDGKIRDEIKLHIVYLGLVNNEEISEMDFDFYTKKIKEESARKKAIVKKEVIRTNFHFNNLKTHNSEDYRMLISIIKNFNDLTLLNFFIPIVLTFERFVHIYVKHVEETKFGIGQFKKRTFFDYNHNEILKLLRIIIGQEAEDIKDHFSEVRMGIELNKKEKVKSYHRGFGRFKPIEYNNDKFALTIDVRGFVQKFYQKFYQKF